jgi:hypothetical protein
MKIKRAIYLGYYLKQLDRGKFNLFLDYTSEFTGKSRATILSDVLRCVFSYNISLLEYFQFGFFNLSKQERKDWAGTGHMYEYQLKMNPLSQRQILEDKTLFHKHYRDFFVHLVADVETLKTQLLLADSLLFNSSGRLVFKSADGKCGREVEIRECEEFDRQSLIVFMEKYSYQLVEEFIEQHPDLNRLSPSAVNTVRIFTELNEKSEVKILGCRLRISVNSSVDNMAAGNLAAPIDKNTGQLSGPAVYSDVTKEERSFHPITKVKIPGFEIPYWEQTIDMIKRAAKKHPQNRSIGWDIVITDEGPGLIEGNHDWCKLLWQLPVKKGMKSSLTDFEEKY